MVKKPGNDIVAQRLGKDILAFTAKLSFLFQEIIRALQFGGPNEDRTHDLRIANAALSQLSYRPDEGENST